MENRMIGPEPAAVVLLKPVFIFKDGEGAKPYPRGKEITLSGLDKLTLLAAKQAVLSSSEEGQRIKAAQKKEVK